MPAESDRVVPQEAVVSSAEAASHRKKQILVVLLLFGLLVAVLTQPKPEDADHGQVVESTLVGKIGAAVNTSSSAEASESPEMRTDRLATIRDFTRIELEDITRFELLAPEPKRVLQVLRNTQRVQAIYGSRAGRAALVGESIVRSGQQLDGQKVLSVTADGIQVAR